jgi:hypothetical protein
MSKSMERRIALQYPSLCIECGRKAFKKMDEERLNGITIHMGICPNCKKECMLIPTSDFEFASGDDSKWD